MSAGDAVYVQLWALFAVVIAAAVLGYALGRWHQVLDKRESDARELEAWKGGHAFLQDAALRCWREHMAPAVWLEGPWQVPVKFLHLPYFIRRRAEDKGIARFLRARDTFDWVYSEW